MEGGAGRAADEELGALLLCAGGHHSAPARRRRRRRSHRARRAQLGGARPPHRASSVARTAPGLVTNPSREERTGSGEHSETQSRGEQEEEPAERRGKSGLGLKSHTHICVVH